MLKTLLVAALVSPLIAIPAFADEQRMSRLEFSRANRCLAYAGLESLRPDPIDLQNLEARFRAAKETTMFDVRTEAEAEAREIRAIGRRSQTPSQIAWLKARRDRACSAFAETTTIAGN